MAKVLLKAGAEVDFLSADEYAKQSKETREFFEKMQRGAIGETITRSAGGFTLDAAGTSKSGPYNGAFGVYRVPTGFDAFLTRASFDYEGSSAASPVTCDVRICADQNTPASLRAVNNTLPTVYEASKSHAPLFRGGQLVVIAFTGGPATTEIYVTVQVILTPRKHISADLLAD
jgi:hypothetical protein